MSLKVNSVWKTNSVNHVGMLIEIVERELTNLFGFLGSREFTIQGFGFDDDAELWDVTLERRINRKIILYRMTIDNDTGQLYGFYRRQ